MSCGDLGPEGGGGRVGHGHGHGVIRLLGE